MFLRVLAALLGCATIVQSCPCPITHDPGSHWWKSGVFYQIYPRSFMDGNNDGIGDLGGIISKLDYLIDLGITAFWVSPIYKSPQIDNGYDISDFRDIEEKFGTLEEFKFLLETAKSKELKVLLDFVPNHTSDEHEWFKKSERREPGYENYYVWVNGTPDKPPNNWISHFHGPAWTYSEIRQQWYLHHFHKKQPDLNFNEPKVREEISNILIYWMDLGVDGFRMDAMPYLVEHPDFPDEPRSNDSEATENDWGYLEHIYTFDQPQTFELVYQWRALLNQYSKEKGGDVRIMITESYSSDENIFAYYGNSSRDGAHFTMNFWLVNKLNATSNAYEFKWVIDSWYELMNHKYTANWVLGSHDEHRVATRYGPQRVDAMNMIVMFLPGVAVTYNGEEIGMEDGEVTWEETQDPRACNGLKEDLKRNSRDFERTPFQWDDSVNGGFNSGAKPWLPVSEKYLETNLANQTVDGIASHFRIYQQLIKLKQSDTLRYGSLEVVVMSETILVLIRRLKGNPTYVLIVNNGGNTEIVDLCSEVLPRTMLVAIPSVQSEKPVGKRVQVNSMTFLPYEAIVLIEY